MKRNIVITSIVIATVLIAFLSMIFIYNLLKSSTGKSDIRQLSDLEVISSYNEYVIAIDEHGELDQYALFKEKEYESYEKQFVLNGIGQAMESRLILWQDDAVYFFGYQIYVYNLNATNGDPELEINPNYLFNGPGTLNRIIGIYDNYIYYEFMRVNDTNNYYGKVNFELNDAIEISEEELPDKLK